MNNSTMKILFSSAKANGTDIWATPDKLYQRIQKELLGDLLKFELDPCADSDNAKCSTFYTEIDNGLVQPWAKFKRIFVNCPYSEIALWVKKAHFEAEELRSLKCRDSAIVMLLPSRTDTIWWHQYVAKSNKIIFLKGRVKFGDSKNSAPFPSAIAVWRGDMDHTRNCSDVQFVDWRP